jgi:hypothetical protein
MYLERCVAPSAVALRGWGRSRKPWQRELSTSPTPTSSDPCWCFTSLPYLCFASGWHVITSLIWSSITDLSVGCEVFATRLLFHSECSTRKQNFSQLVCYLLHAGFLLGLFFDREDEGDMFHRNVGWLSTDYTALYPRRYNSSFSLNLPDLFR